MPAEIDITVPITGDGVGDLTANFNSLKTQNLKVVRVDEIEYSAEAPARKQQYACDTMVPMNAAMFLCCLDQTTSTGSIALSLDGSGTAGRFCR